MNYSGNEVDSDTDYSQYGHMYILVLNIIGIVILLQRMNSELLTIKV